MKKGFGWVAICLVVWTAFCLAGCGTTEAVETEDVQNADVAALIEEARQNLEEAENYTGALNVVSRMEDSEDNTEVSIAFCQEPLQMKVESVNTFDGQTNTTQTYLDDDTDEGINMYMNYNGQWTEMMLTEEAAMESMQIYDVRENMNLLLQYATNWMETTNEGRQITLSAVVPAEHVYDVVEGGKLLYQAGMSGMAETYYAGVSDVLVTVVLKEATGEPVSCSMDLAKTLQTVTDNVLRELQAEGEGFSVQEYRITMDISQLGSTQPIEIPTEAHKAINYELEISDMQQTQNADA